MSTFYETLIWKDTPLKQKDNMLALFNSAIGIVRLHVQEIESFTKNIDLAIEKKWSLLLTVEF